MPRISNRTVSLPTEQADLRDAAFERWLREEVAPIYDATKADPASRIPADSVFAEARARYEGRGKARRNVD